MLHVGERYVVTGPRNLSLAEMAGVLSRELGRPVEYVDKVVAVDHQNGIFRGETDVVERIGGQQPQALDAFIREHRTVFGAAEAVAS